MYEKNEIDLIQLDNLIRNRVPFVYFQLDEKKWKGYIGLEKMHLEQWGFVITQETNTELAAVFHLTDRAIAKEFPIVIHSENQEDSLNLKKYLAAQGYSNVFSVSDVVVG